MTCYQLELLSSCHLCHRWSYPVYTFFYFAGIRSSSFRLFLILLDLIVYILLHQILFDVIIVYLHI